MKYYLGGPPPKKEGPKAPVPKSSVEKARSMLNKHQRLIIALFLVFLGSAVLWGIWKSLPNSRVKKANDIQEQLSQMEENNVPWEQRQELRETRDRMMRDMTPAEMRLLFQERSQKEAAKMKDFARMTPEERNNYLD